MPNGIFYEEYFIVNYDKLERDLQDPYDVTTWGKYIWNNTSENTLIINNTFKNDYFVYDKFYNSFIEPVGCYDIITLNVNNFISINNNDAEELCITHLFEFIQHHVKLCMCVQEIKFTRLNKIIDLCKVRGLFHSCSAISSIYNSHVNIIISKVPIHILEINSLINVKNFAHARQYTLFTIENISEKFLTTQLELYPSLYHMKNPSTINSIIRLKQMHQIFELAPDFIIGDLNIAYYNNYDLKFLTSRYSINCNPIDRKTTAYGTTTDYICSKYPKVYDTFVINYKYSDHNAVGINL
jgi:uncharacterized membrane protein